MTDGAPRTFSREVLDLFDAFVHGDVSRRGFLDGCAKHVGSAGAAAATLAALSPDFAGAQVVQPGDARIRVRTAEIPSPAGSGSIKAYVAEPAGRGGKHGVVLVVHENRGLNPHIEDIARRLATDGFVAVAPDALTKLGGYPGDEDKARELFPKLDQAKIQEDFVAAAKWAEALPEGNGKLGAVGFCYGGGMVNTLATRLPELRAAVPFYGQAPAAEKVAAIKATVLANYAGNDKRLTDQWPAYEAALTAAKVPHQGFVYEGVEHGFNNDTTPRFNKAAADLAWGRTLALFREKLA